ncbi:MAG: hypothetical protein AAGF88_13055 [Pseudomonadota bacterium]
MALQWFEDPEDYLVDLRPGPADRPARINDAYAQWVLRHGAQFNLTEEYREPGGNPEDFDFVIAYRDLDGQDRGGAIDALVAKGAAPAGVGSPPLDGLYIGRLPIRKASVSPRIDGAEDAAPAPDEVTLELPTGLDPSKLVVVGVMDDAIQVGHMRFRDAEGRSRVDAAWIQDGVFSGSPALGPRPPLYRQFGHVLHRHAIDAAIAAHGDDDDALMQALGLVAAPGAPYWPTPLRMLASHGTHIADLAAGYDPDDAAGLHRRIMAVQLPVFASEETSGIGLTAAIIAGSGFIFDHARALSRAAGVPIPVVLNFSYGFGGGWRNGTDIVERALRAQAAAYRRAVAADLSSAPPPAVTILPAGNGNLSRTHAQAVTPENGSAQLTAKLRLQPDDKTSSYVEFWLPQGSTKVTLNVAAPNGFDGEFTVDLPADPVDPGALTRANDYVLAAAGAGLDPATIVGRVSVDLPSEYPRADGAAVPGRWRVLLALAPTAALIAGRPVVPHGLWSVTCTATGALAGDVMHAWLQRDETNLGFPMRGRQSYFDDPTYEASRFDALTDIAVRDISDSSVRRNGTVSGIATRQSTGADEDNHLTVGAARWDITGPTIYTAAGFDALSNPEVLAPGDTSRILDGVLASANRGVAVIPLNGTSVAAPQVARIIADAAEATEPERYAEFSALMVVRGLATPPVRPNGVPERASNNVVREERSEIGTLDPPRSLEAAVARGNIRK